jgi:hypothetical protein
MQWIYVPEKAFDFYRIGFWHNLSKNLVPKGHQSLYGEISYLPSQISSKKVNYKKLKNSTYKSMVEACFIFGIHPKDFVTKKILHIPNAYVIYDNWREKNLTKIHNNLNQLSIYSVGRYGEWKYSSMQDAILDGKTTSEKILKQLEKEDKFIPAIKYKQPKRKKIIRKRISLQKEVPGE